MRRALGLLVPDPLTLTPLALGSLAIGLLASCDNVSGPARQPRSDEVGEPVPAAMLAAPDTAATAAPGVAFNYRYAFRLPAERIAAVQEEHQQACERLGINRCRINGMRYHLVGKGDVEAMLAFKLDPAIARQFGKDGAASVSKAEGMTVDSEVSGADAAAAIRQANRTVAQLTDELAKVESRLAHKGLSSEERERLTEQADNLRRSIRANRDERQDQAESLATTPMVFNYGSGDLVPGFDTRSPVRHALEQAGDNFIAGVSILFVVALTILPWALLAALGWWLARIVRRRLPDARPEAEPVAMGA